MTPSYFPIVMVGVYCLLVGLVGGLIARAEKRRRERKRRIAEQTKRLRDAVNAFGEVLVAHTTPGAKLRIGTMQAAIEVWSLGELPRKPVFVSRHREEASKDLAGIQARLKAAAQLH